METIKRIVQQEIVEQQFNRLLVDKKIKEYLLENHSSYITSSVELFNVWINGNYYESKNIRLNTLKELDITELVTKVLVCTTHCQREELFTSVSAQLAGVVGFSDKPDALKTIAEVLAVICESDAFDILKNDSGRLVLISRLQLSKELEVFVENTMYLPPMLVKPVEVKSNTDTGYLTFKDSLILGKGNYHGGDVCLDAINIANSVPLKVNVDLVSKYEMKPTFDVNTPEQKEQWSRFKFMVYRVMALLASNDNEFWLTHRVDKRGRLYSQGYWLNSQGTAYQKAAIDFAESELVEVPNEYRI